MNIRFMFRDELTRSKHDGSRPAASDLLKEIGFVHTTCSRRSIVAFFDPRQLNEGETVASKLEPYKLRLRTFFQAWNLSHD